MATKLTIPALKIPATPKPVMAPKKSVIAPLRGPSVLGGDEDEFLAADEGNIATGEVVRAPLKPLVKPTNALPAPKKLITGLPVVKSAIVAYQEEQAEELAKAPPPKKIHLPTVGLTVPPLECSTCHVGASCPKCSEGDVCAFEKDFTDFDVRSTSGVLAALEMMVRQNLKRLQIMYLSEQFVSGGMADPQITRLASEVQNQIINLLNLRKQSQTVTVEATGKASEGILSRMFGKARNAPSPVDLHPEETVERSTVKVTMTRQQRNELEED